MKTTMMRSDRRLEDTSLEEEHTLPRTSDRAPSLSRSSEFARLLETFDLRHQTQTLEHSTLLVLPCRSSSRFVSLSSMMWSKRKTRRRELGRHRTRSLDGSVLHRSIPPTSIENRATESGWDMDGARSSMTSDARASEELLATSIRCVGWDMVPLRLDRLLALDLLVVGVGLDLCCSTNCCWCWCCWCSSSLRVWLSLLEHEKALGSREAHQRSESDTQDKRWVASTSTRARS